MSVHGRYTLIIWAIGGIFVNGRIIHAALGRHLFVVVTQVHLVVSFFHDCVEILFARYCWNDVGENYVSQFLETYCVIVRELAACVKTYGVYCYTELVS